MLAPAVGKPAGCASIEVVQQQLAVGERNELDHPFAEESAGLAAEGHADRPLLVMAKTALAAPADDSRRLEIGHQLHRQQRRARRAHSVTKASRHVEHQHFALRARSQLDG